MGDIQGIFTVRRMAIGDTPTFITDTSTGRNCIHIKNLTDVPVSIGGRDTVTFDTIPDGGWPLGLNETISIGIAERSTQITGFHSVQVYGICALGTSTQIAIMEETKQEQRLPS